MLIVVSPFFLLYSGLTGKHRAGLGQRFGFLKGVPLNGDAARHRIWMHAASVGEVQVARALFDEIKKQIPDAALILSTVTEQGQKVAQDQLDKKVRLIYAPLDLGRIVNRALQAIRPDIYICLETELWPAILRHAHNRGVKLLLLNARLSEGSFKHYRKIRGFLQDILPRFDSIAAIRREDAKRYIALGAPASKVKVLGNAKYDAIVAQAAPEVEEAYRKQLNLADNETVFVAGSTHTGEEEMLLEVYRSLAAPGRNLVWVIAPRHLQRLDDIENLLINKNVRFEKLSAVKRKGRKENVVIVDTMGDLAGLYSVATYVFCGGSLVPRGGHNILEAAVWGKPVFYGPSMSDFADAKNQLESCGASLPVTGVKEITERILHLESHPVEYAEICRRAKEATLPHFGAAKKQVQLVKEILTM